MSTSSFIQLSEKITNCRQCPRLVEWRENVAIEKVKRFQDEEYWGKPVPAFGDINGRLLIVGLAPAAHGANRTGRMFTGDRSGEWLYRALHKFGFANQAESVGRDDGLTLSDCLITAILRCAPPQNKPTTEEKENCFDFFQTEFDQMKNISAIVALGKIAFDGTLKMMKKIGHLEMDTKPIFKHAESYRLNRNITLIASYHPSQQNTFTGKLTQEMFDTVFQVARTVMETRAA